jgi:hypothetical protein
MIKLKDIITTLNKKYSLKYIKRGSQGLAFKINNKVLKITKDKEEAKIAQYIISNQSKYFNKIYSVKKIMNSNYYLIISKFVTVLNKKEQDISFKFLIDTNINHQEFINQFKDKSKVKFIIESINKIISELIKYDLMSYNIDLHSKNLGYDKDIIVFFDISDSNFYKSINNIPEINLQ